MRRYAGFSGNHSSVCFLPSWYTVPSCPVLASKRFLLACRSPGVGERVAGPSSGSLETCDDGFASTTWMESRHAMLESLSLPCGQGLPQNGNYIPISEGLLQKPRLEVAKQFQAEGFQILDRLETHMGRGWRSVVESFYPHTTQPPPPCFRLAPENDGSRCGKNHCPLGS